MLLAQEPEKGGARKSRVAVPQEWLEKIRKAWERVLQCVAGGFS